MLTTENQTNPKQNILDAIAGVREALKTGQYDQTRWHPAFVRLNQLVGVVCGVFEGEDDEGDEDCGDDCGDDCECDDPAVPDTGEIKACRGGVMSELKPYAVAPTLDDVLAVAAKHCYSVKFTFSGD